MGFLLAQEETCFPTADGSGDLWCAFSIIQQIYTEHPQAIDHSCRMSTEKKGWVPVWIQPIEK